MIVPNAHPASALTIARHGLMLGLLWRPRSAARLATPGAFFLACALLAALAFALDSWRTPAPRMFVSAAAFRLALEFLQLLLAGWIASHVLRRPTLWLTLAALLAFASIPMLVLFSALAELFIDAERYWQLLPWLYAGVTLAWAWQTLRHLDCGTGHMRQLIALLLIALLVLVPSYFLPSAQFWYPLPEHDAATEHEPAPPLFDPEAVLYQQPRRVHAALQRLRPQTPGSPDLYVLGFAGDGDERVFGNEVDYLQTLFAQRFGAAGRVLGLINAPSSTGTAPLATRTNLRHALRGIGATMDVDEDVLLLMLTSHGSAEHELYVNLPPLPLHQITPADLRDALDDAGIRWRVVVVSACYSGGFIKALRDPHTLVITAAAVDRTSFGCGADADITWFGRALLVQALNQTTDFVDAFRRAERQIRAWERADGIDASDPQLFVGPLIRAKLDAWRAQFVPGAAVAFAPTPATPAPPESAPTATAPTASATDPPRRSDKH